MKRSALLSILFCAWLTALTVLALWPVVGDAPWEPAPPSSRAEPTEADKKLLRCGDALERRRVALAALAEPRREGDREYSPARRQLTYSPTLPPWTEAERQLTQAQEDIERLC